ncbi:MAG: nitroreductase family protein [Clostridia bacterium]|nr:nitroreductase family protein [Clostridia bacterium]
MEFTKLIEERRSIRAYTDEKPGKAQIEELLKAVQLAPTWKNSQTGRYYIIVSDEMLGKVRDALPAFNQNSSKGAALVVTTFVKNTSGFTQGNPDNELGNMWGAYDLGLQNAYLCLKAKDMGLDTLIMGLRDANKLREVLSVPEEEQITAVIALGYRNQEAVFKPRKELDEIAKVF